MYKGRRPKIRRNGLRLWSWDALLTSSIKLNAKDSIHVDFLDILPIDIAAERKW